MVGITERTVVFCINLYFENIIAGNVNNVIETKLKANKLINKLKKLNKPVLPDEFKPVDQYQLLKQL